MQLYVIDDQLHYVRMVEFAYLLSFLVLAPIKKIFDLHVQIFYF
jgi:hypothetical protein